MSQSSFLKGPDASVLNTCDGRSAVGITEVLWTHDAVHQTAGKRRISKTFERQINEP